MSEPTYRPAYPSRPETTYDERLDDVRAPQWEEAVAASAEAAALVPGDAPLAPEEVTGNLRRYARWQWRDYWQRRGFWLAGAALFGVWVLVHWMLADRLRYDDAAHAWRTIPVPDDAVFAMSHVAFAVGGVLAGLLGVGGLVSRERERGLQRFLFAKPVNILRYYLQGLAVNSVGSLLVLAGAVLLAAATAGHALAVGSLLAIAGACYALGAGATFLASTLVRVDAPLVGAWLVAGFPVVALAENGYWFGKVAQWLFPQGPALAVLKSVMPRADSFTPHDFLAAIMVAVVVAVAYGVAGVAAGVAVLRRRSIQT